MAEMVDSKAYAVTFIQKIPYLILCGIIGAIAGTGVYLLIALNMAKNVTYVCEKEYYIEFTEDWEKDYYNDYTWNDVIMTDNILGVALQGLDNYDRDVVKEMIEARIYSDVRYLTVKYTGKDKEYIGKLSEAMNQALTDFPERVKELTSITCIEDGQVYAQKEKLFTFRAVLFGLIAGVIIYIFVFTWKFSLLEAFYTRYDIIDFLGLNALAVSDVKNSDCSLVDINTSYEELKTYAGKKLVIAIPQGKQCKGAVKELLIIVANLGLEITGAVLVNCSKSWLKMYGIKNFDGIYDVK